MNYKKLLAASLLLTFSAVPAALSVNYTQYTPPQTIQNNYANFQQPLYGHVVTVPAGAGIPAVTQMQLSTETLSPNQLVSVTLSSPYYYNGTLIAPAGSIVNGTVAEVVCAKRAGRNARLRILFSSITTPNGQSLPISGYIKTSDNTGTLVGGTAMDTTKAYAKDIAIGSGSGAVLGVIGAAVSGGSIGKGAALMTAVGAGAGLAKSLWDKGGEIVIPANSQIEVQLSQPITVSVQGN